MRTGALPNLFTVIIPIGNVLFVHIISFCVYLCVHKWCMHVCGLCVWVWVYTKVQYLLSSSVAFLVFETRSFIKSGAHSSARLLCQQAQGF